MDNLERIEKIVNTNNTILQIKIEAILATFDEEQKKRYKAHLTELTSGYLNQLLKTSSKEHIEAVKNILGL